MFPGDPDYRAPFRRVRAPVLPPTVDESIAAGSPLLHSKSCGSSLSVCTNVDLVLPTIVGATRGVSRECGCLWMPVDEPVDAPVDAPVAVPVSVEKECAVPTDEKAFDVLSKPDPARVEVMRNGSVAIEPLVVAVSSSSVAQAIPYTRRSPLEGESESQFVGCLSDLVVPVMLPVA